MTMVAALAAGAALALTGCSAGQISQTADQVAAINGNHAEVGKISLRNVHIVFPPSGEHTNVAGGKALLALSFVNNSETTADELTKISTDLGEVKITAPDGGSTVKLQPQQTVVAAGADTTTAASGEHGAEGEHGTETTTAAPTTTEAPNQPAAEGEDPEADPARIEITGLTKDIVPGLTYTVTFDFKENGTVQMEVPVDAGTVAERHESDLSKASEGGSGGGH
ncbi:hypothetical protein GV794_16010 [Nocardia cyriacigeorgica]|uniref:Copper chaperone PCu(A)C n=2 Tax=Nocardia cyriacigeorgica TaxID=135487 RepID=A0A6P1D4B1_9NOCA|nr:hypothetical protein [Nocardia cyriacigeorgica]NEW44868.1 hypothetical protein [Nocardia cyriacigeorgica]NEW53104.1 hypothetical protein [Nocardia cyriacigeorgica]NEW57149.1 hypothetical protein [Nocardia cyriacigeorgica]